MNATQPLDTRELIETPEGIILELTLAGPVVRALAWGIDLVLRSLLLVALFFSLRFLGHMSTGLLLIFWFALEWFYPVWFEWRQHGATPGKAIMGIKVVRRNGMSLSFGDAMVRNLLRVIDILPGFYTFGLVSMLLSPRFQRIGDHVANTLVVYENEAPPPAPDNDIAAAPPRYTLNPAEQQAVVNFAARSYYLTPERAEELAQLTGPLVLKGSSQYQQLLAIANWIKGKQV